MTDTAVRPAKAVDEENIRALLLAADLPAADIAGHLPHFLVAVRDGEIIGTAGMEISGDIGLLRSLAVASAYRGRGIGKLLCGRMLEYARRQGVAQLYLLTITAEDFFRRLGFHRTAGDTAPSAIRATKEFTTLCPATAVLMTKKIEPAAIVPEELIKNYGRLVSSICRRMIRDPETAQDAAQEVWLEVLKSLDSFRGEAKISTWIYAIASRVVMNYAKNEKLYTTKILSNYFHGEELPLPVEIDFDKELWVKEMCDKCLTGILHCLQNEARMAYIFRDIVGLNYGEIAEILDKDEKTVRQTVSRSRRKLKGFLENECALFNPQGSCRCRMKKWVEEVNLPQEYEKLRKTVTGINLYRESEKVMPDKNFWEKYL